MAGSAGDLDDEVLQRFCSNWSFQLVLARLIMQPLFQDISPVCIHSIFADEQNISYFFRA